MCSCSILIYDVLLQVDVGNFLRFKSCVLYTELENPEKPLINVEVVAHVTRPEKRVSEVSMFISLLSMSCRILQKSFACLEFQQDHLPAGCTLKMQQSSASPKCISLNFVMAPVNLC